MPNTVMSDIFRILSPFFDLKCCQSIVESEITDIGKRPNLAIFISLLMFFQIGQLSSRGSSSPRLCSCLVSLPPPIHTPLMNTRGTWNRRPGRLKNKTPEEPKMLSNCRSSNTQKKCLCFHTLG